MIDQFAKVRNGAIVNTGPRPTGPRGEVSDETLAAWGHLPIIDTPPDHNPETHRVRRQPQDQWAVGEAQVLTTWDVIALTQEELEAQGQEDVEATIGRITAKVDSLLKAGATYKGVRWSCLNQDAIYAVSLYAGITSGRGLPNGRTSRKMWDTSGTRHALTAAEHKELAEARADYTDAVRDRADDLMEAVYNDTYTESMLAEGWPE